MRHWPVHEGPLAYMGHWPVHEGPLGVHGTLTSEGPLGVHGTLTSEGPLGVHGTLTSEGPLGVHETLTGARRPAWRTWDTDQCTKARLAYTRHWPVHEGPLGVHEVELVVKPRPGLSDGSGVGKHAHRPCNLRQVPTRHHRRGLVVDANLIITNKQYVRDC